MTKLEFLYSEYGTFLSIAILIGVMICFLLWVSGWYYILTSLKNKYIYILSLFIPIIPIVLQVIDIINHHRSEKNF